MNKLLKHLAYYTYYYLYLIVGIVRYLLIIPFMTPYQVGVKFSKNAKNITNFLEKSVGLAFKVKGKENIPWDRPIIIVSKHQSGLEAAALSTFLPPHIYIVKKELIYIPFAGLVCMASNQIWIDRKKNNANELLNKQVTERFNYGLSLCIFPEGTRTKPGDHDTVYKTGAAHIAQNLKVDLLPIALNTGEFFSKGFFKESGTATISVLPIIPWNAAENPKALMELVREAIETEQTNIEGQGPLFKKSTT